VTDDYSASAESIFRSNSEAPAQQPFQPKLHMTDADFHSITLNGKLCDGEGGMGLREFEKVMREQVLRPSPFPSPDGFQCTWTGHARVEHGAGT
jgi:hypothetical protein